MGTSVSAQQRGEAPLAGICAASGVWGQFCELSTEGLKIIRHSIVSEYASANLLLSVVLFAKAHLPAIVVVDGATFFVQLTVHKTERYHHRNYTTNCLDIVEGLRSSGGVLP